MKKHICPVCGYDELEEPAYDEYGYGSYEICSCCGFEYGVTDDDQGFTFDSYREMWIQEGYKFKWEDDRPEGWNHDMAKTQLLNLQKKFK